MDIISSLFSLAIWYMGARALWVSYHFYMSKETKPSVSFWQAFIGSKGTNLFRWTKNAFHPALPKP